MTIAGKNEIYLIYLIYLFGKILPGHFWYTNFWDPDPPYPLLLASNTSLGETAHQAGPPQRGGGGSHQVTVPPNPSSSVT